jgi:lysophospholipase L1-like esterase
MIGKTLTYNYRNNSYGCRGPEFKIPKPEGVKRILTFGGSTTWDGPENSGTWPALMEKKLREHYKTDKIDVVNFAVDGGISPISLIRLALTGLDVKPDLIIVYHGANDILFFPYENLQGDYTPFVQPIHPDPPTPLQFRIPKFFLRSYIISVITYRIDKKYFRAHLHKEVYPAFAKYKHRKGDDLAKMDLFLRNLKTMRGIAREHDAGFLGATFHWIKNSESTTRFNGRLRTFFEKEEIPFADIDLKLPHETTDVHVDEVHFTPEGLQRIASIFFEEIKNRNLLELKPVPANKQSE